MNDAAKPARSAFINGASVGLGQAIALALAASICFPPAAAGDPLPRIVPEKPGSSACFRRDYDAAHLARHPRQATVSMLLSFRYERDAYVERITMRRKDRPEPLHIVGSCGWSDQANRDTSGNRMIKAYTKTAGYDCIVVVSPSSAEEGGYFLVDLAPDGKTAMLYLDSPITTWGGSPERGTGQLALGADDRVFRLQRTDAAACKAMEDALEGP